jgi:hypothetical protein
MTQKQINVNPKDATPITCLDCGSDVFVEVKKIGVVSKLLIGTPEDAYVAQPITICWRCGIPLGMKSQDQPEADETDGIQL